MGSKDGDQKFKREKEKNFDFERFKWESEGVKENRLGRKKTRTPDYPKSFCPVSIPPKF